MIVRSHIFQKSSFFSKKIQFKLLLIYIALPLSLQEKEQVCITMKSIRSILSVPGSHWVGDGFHVKPLFDDLAFTKEVSPFLMFDYASPKNFPPTTRKLGVGVHPHRGFETVSLAFQGEVEHGDSRGNKGVIGPGDVQWMTAGAGIIHEEFHSREFAKSGGPFEFVQLWVNLPAKYKMTPPKYQAITKEEIPTVKTSGGSVRIIAGNFQGTKGPAQTFTHVDLWDVRIDDNSDLEFSIRENHNLVIFVRTGSVGVVTAGEKVTPLGTHKVALMSMDGTNVRLKSLAPDSSILVLSGEVINEPIAARGPFVMNTNDELRQAIVDYQTGRMG